MKRSVFAPFILTLIAALLFRTGVSRAVAAPERPNVIFILGDDQAWWDYSFMYRPGVEKAAIDLDSLIRQVAQTPAIDRLADQSLAFTHGYVMPLCRPSLASMITGVFPHQHFITGNDLVGRPPDEAVEYRMQLFQTLPRILSARLGYTSFQTGKWWEGHPSNGGFGDGDTANSVSLSNPDTRPQQWSGAKPSYVTARHGDWGLMIGRVDYVNQVANPPHPINYANTIVPATDFINAEVAANRPFFLWYAPFLAHDPFDPPAGLLNKYDPLVAENDETNDPVAKYYANIERFDGGVGALLDHLDTKGIAENTIVVLICDNGYIKADTGTYAPKSKTSPYDGGVRTPILVRWPARIKAGGALPPQVITKPVSIVDLVPTVLSALGLEKSPEMTGVDLLDLSAVNSRDAVFGEDNAIEIQNLPVPSQSLEAQYVVRDGWKLILLAGGGAELYQLYNTATGAPVDPFETNDVSAANPALVSELSARITSWYDEPKTLEWQAGPGQAVATNLTAPMPELGQSLTPATGGYLAAVRVGLKPIASNQSITLELRDLDGTGAVTGALRSSVILSPDQLILNETRWYLFALNQPINLAAGTPVGFKIVSSAGAGGLAAAYAQPGGYPGGKMIYPGLIGGMAWTANNLDLAFETLWANRESRSEMRIARVGNQVNLVGLMSFKQQPVTLQSSTDLETWSDSARRDNLDGLPAWTSAIDQPRKYFHLRPEAAGAILPVNPVNVTLYSENFAGPASNLNGMTPDVTTAAANWTAPTTVVFLGDGSLSGTTASTAHLPFSPQHGFVYTLSATIEMGATNSTNWAAFGFLRNPPITGAIHAGTPAGGILWALTRNDSVNPDQVLHENVAGGTGLVLSGDYATGATTVNMTLVLDTTGGTGNWNYDWIVDGTARITARPLPASFESATGGVGIAKHNSLSPHVFRSFALSRQ